MRSAGRGCSTVPALPGASCQKDDKAGIDGDRAGALMLANPTLIKRPVLDVDGRLTVGFKPEIYETAVRAAS